MTNLTTEEIIKRYPVGTVLRLTVTVSRTNPNDPGLPVRVDLSAANDDAWLTPAALAAAEIVSQPIQAGDKVRRSGGIVGVVVAVDGAEAWVRDPALGHATLPLTDLELA